MCQEKEMRKNFTSKFFIFNFDPTFFKRLIINHLHGTTIDILTTYSNIG